MELVIPRHLTVVDARGGWENTPVGLNGWRIFPHPFNGCALISGEGGRSHIALNSPDEIVGGELHLVRRTDFDDDPVLRAFRESILPLNVVHKIWVSRVVGPVVPEFTDDLAF